MQSSRALLDFFEETFSCPPLLVLIFLQSQPGPPVSVLFQDLKKKEGRKVSRGSPGESWQESPIRRGNAGYAEPMGKDVLRVKLQHHEGNSVDVDSVVRRCPPCYDPGIPSRRRLEEDLGGWQDDHVANDVEESQRGNGQDAVACRCPLE